MSPRPRSSSSRKALWLRLKRSREACAAPDATDETRHQLAEDEAAWAAFLAAAPPPASRSRPIEERFWGRVNKGAGCWLWTGHRNDDGYGMIGSGGRIGFKMRSTHRLSWELHHGPIPEGMSVLHRCDTPACVRPDHLFIGTQRDNMADASQKGRLVTVRRFGESNAQSVLTAADVVVIRETYAARQATQAQLAGDYKITQSHLSSIVRGDGWPEAGGPITRRNRSSVRKRQV